MMGMKVPTTCKPPPIPSASTSPTQPGALQIVEQRAKTVDEQRLTDQIEEVDEGAADVHGEHEHEIDHEQKERDAEASAQHHSIDAVGQRAADPMALPHHPLAQHVGMTEAGIGDMQIRVLAGALRDEVTTLRRARHCLGPDDLLHDRIGLQQLQGQPARIGPLGPVLQQGQEIGDRLLDTLAMHQRQPRRLAPLAHGQQTRLQLRQSLLGDRDHRHHRTAERVGQLAGIDPRAAFAGHVHHVEGHHDRHPHLQQLDAQIEIALQVARIQHIDDEVGLAAQQIIAGDHLVERVGVERIDARQIDHPHSPPVEFQRALLALHRHARPVSGGLADPGQGIEQGGFAAVGIARERHGQRAVRSTPRHLGTTGDHGHASVTVPDSGR